MTALESRRSSSPANEKAGVPPAAPPKLKPVLAGGALLAGVPKPKAGAEDAPPAKNEIIGLGDRQVPNPLHGI
jgi:hypothetical protein